MYKYFKDQNNQVWAFLVDGSQDAYIDTIKLTPIDQAEADQLRAEPVEALAQASDIVVSPRQIRKQLNILGLREQVENIVANSNNQDLQDAWQFATQFVEKDALVTDMAAALNLSNEALHTLFVDAKKL